MTAAFSYKIVNFIAMFGWLLLIFFPTANLTKSIVRSGVLSILLSIIYIICLFLAYEVWVPGSGYATLQSVRLMFTNEWALLAGWSHYLAFDLLIGVLTLKKLVERKFVIRALCLFGIFVLGPLGWLISLAFTQSRQNEI